MMLSLPVVCGASDLWLAFMEDMDTSAVLPFTYHLYLISGNQCVDEHLTGLVPAVVPKPMVVTRHATRPFLKHSAYLRQLWRNSKRIVERCGSRPLSRSLSTLYEGNEKSRDKEPERCGKLFHAVAWRPWRPNMLVPTRY